jgi:hypothetical protein
MKQYIKDFSSFLNETENIEIDQIEKSVSDIASKIDKKIVLHIIKIRK